MFDKNSFFNPKLLRQLPVTSLAGIIATATFALLTVAGAKISIPFGELPLTLQTVAVYSSGLFLGMRKAFLSQVLYLFLGLFVPVFAGEGTGLEYLSTRASSGFLLAFPFVAALIGWLSARWQSYPGIVGAVQCGSLLLFSLGLIWLHVAINSNSFYHTMSVGWLPYIPMDLFKVLLTATIFFLVRQRFQSREKVKA